MSTARGQVSVAATEPSDPVNTSGSGRNQPNSLSNAAGQTCANASPPANDETPLVVGLAVGLPLGMTLLGMTGAFLFVLRAYRRERKLRQQLPSPRRSKQKTTNVPDSASLHELGARDVDELDARTQFVQLPAQSRGGRSR